MLTADITKNNLESKVIEQKKMVICNHKSNFAVFFVCQHLRHISVSSVSRWGRTSRPPAASSTARAHWPSLWENQSEASSVATPTPPADLTVMTYFSLSSDRWSTLSGFRLSARIFFFFSLSVCFFAPLRPSPCKKRLIVFDSYLLGTAAVVYKKNVFPNAWYNDNIHRNLLIQTFCWMPPNWCVLL